MKTPSPFSFLFGKESTKSRRGISPVIATTIILAITITLGLALWGFANSGVGTATTQYSQTVDRYGEFVGDRFVIANIDFDNPSSGNVAFWIFNSGKLPTTINDFVLTCRDCGSALPSVSLTDPVTVPSKELTKVTFELTGTTPINGNADFGGRTYELTVISETGATQHMMIRSN